MRVTQVVTDYVQKSILTTQGDMIVRGASIPERLAAAAAGLVLKAKGAGVKPAYEEIYSLLTTWGDIIVRGETAALRLPVGALDFVFTSRGPGETPNWQTLYKLLTTQGDIVVRGAAAAERLPAGTSGQSLKTLGAGDNPVWGDVSIFRELGAGSNLIRTKIYEIGDWDMNTNAQKNVAHGLGAAFVDIRGVQAIVRNDAATLLHDLMTSDGAGMTEGSVAYIDGGNVTLQRRTGGTFDGATYGTTPYNRGWVRLWYKV